MGEGAEREMSDDPRNPPAFPNSVQPDFQFAHDGMTLRDYFAAHALIGIMSTAGAFSRADRRPEMVARQAFIFADEMLDARAGESLEGDDDDAGR